MGNVRTQDMGNRQAITVRLDHDVHEALRSYSFHTRRSANDLITRLLRDHLFGSGQEELIDAVVSNERESHRVALDKLRG